MNRQELVHTIREKQSYLCIGLDTDLHRIPRHLHAHADPVFAFNKAIIDATKDLCVSYKINTAFYECMGIRGWETLQRTIEYIPEGIFTIADAKRGDIGNTATQYAKTFFDTFQFDSVTVAPYMGKDSVTPFLEFSGKWAILLGLTSNEGSGDFQLQRMEGGEYLYEKVLRAGTSWGSADNLMFVVGATQTEQMARIRALVPDHFFLVPGVGAQGGDLAQISQLGMNKDCGLLVNVSRGIIYAGNGEDFATDARQAAQQYQTAMADLLARTTQTVGV
ncbi:orotidine-5'-phosphate decarboxylase [Chitinophaga costaii]|uniref:Orotidine-5'-phosphate decarboxylase n=1 Tax=Chitinophaga costaii TaxID=1335309 RepID=A0A1C4D4M8_9BACT|nr:orotidine-5'-phosphate decarboxylase [Chitinophaga costaii]PUZ24681.1 orotidine-5'-phosphate decarboxylase [Chitinophaga costaii]SCC26200.1 orotidine-5'-phosphate decarboxylase [Chitinophaga costaii]